MSNITISEAETSNLESLTTIVARSFHPINPYIKQCLPDTPTMRQWYACIFSEEIENNACHPLAAFDSATNTNECIGVLTLRLMKPEQKGAGFWTQHSLTPDHDESKCRSMIDGMVEHREKLMLGRPHYLIELFGADHEFKGKGVGSKLIAKACEIADQDGYQVFVQSNASARSFYERFGFSVEEEVAMPGDEDYVECMMVRQAKIKEI